MQRLEVSGAVRHMYMSLGGKGMWVLSSTEHHYFIIHSTVEARLVKKYCLLREPNPKLHFNN
jgi:hypothetical protein